MSSEQLLNVKFVEAVEASPCLWDNKSRHYRNKEYVRDAWYTISVQFMESVETCRERWRNIRNAFLRSMKRQSDESNIKKQYYLKTHLQFLMPFVRNKPASNESSNYSDAEDTKASESEEDIKPGAFLEASQANDSMESFRNDVGTEPVSLQLTRSQVTNTPTALPANLSQQSDDKFTQKFAAAESLPNKRRKRNEDEGEDDSDLMFFKSLLRDVRQMNDKQNRKFRFRVMQIVDEILDEGLDTNG